MHTKPIPPTPKPAAPTSAPLIKALSIDALLQAAFKNLDANSDGSINRAEVLKSLGPAAKMPIADLLVGQVMKTLDVSGDGLITKSELTAYLNKVDANHDGSLSASEIHAAGVGFMGVIGLFGPHPGG